MRLPNEVVVGPYTFKIKKWSTNMTQDKDALGQFLPREEYIGIDPSLKGILLLDTLIHEINHAVYFVYNILDEDKEERTVNALSTAWVKIYLDNPSLLGYINSIVK